MSSQDTFEVQVQLAFQQVVEELGEIFSFGEFLASVVSWRQNNSGRNESRRICQIDILIVSWKLVSAHPSILRGTIDDRL